MGVLYLSPYIYTYPSHPSTHPSTISPFGRTPLCLSVFQTVFLSDRSLPLPGRICAFFSVSLLVSDCVHVSVSFSKCFFPFRLHISARVCGSASLGRAPLWLFLCGWLWVCLLAYKCLCAWMCLLFWVWVSPLHNVCPSLQCVHLLPLSRWVSPLSPSESGCVHTVPLSRGVSFPSPQPLSLDSMSVSSLCFSYSAISLLWVSGCESSRVYPRLRLSPCTSVRVSASFSLSLPPPSCVCLLSLFGFLSPRWPLCVHFSQSPLPLCGGVSAFLFLLQYLCALFSFSLCLFCRMWVFLRILPALRMCVHACILVLLCFCLIHWLE